VTNPDAVTCYSVKGWEQDGFFGKEGTQQLRQTASGTPFENQGTSSSLHHSHFQFFLFFILHPFSLTASLGVKLGHHCRCSISDQRCCVSETFWDTETSIKTSSSQSGEFLFLFLFYLV